MTSHMTTGSMIKVKLAFYYSGEKTVQGMIQVPSMLFQFFRNLHQGQPYTIIIVGQVLGPVTKSYAEVVNAFSSQISIPSYNLNDLPINYQKFSATRSAPLWERNPDPS